MGPEFGVWEGGAWEWSYNMWVLVDVMEVQGQDVILASNVHAVMVLIHTQDPVVGCVEEVGEVMSSTSGSQLCLETEIYSLKDSCGAHAHFHPHMRTQLTHSSCHS